MGAGEKHQKNWASLPTPPPHTASFITGMGGAKSFAEGQAPGSVGAS